ncbi:hypothetical protein TRSC58_02732 [Trypanosoma rangeli SC58]|uniref:Uncharacterized protein n=1 Tax=Trypanosoma rangeli SC58 TaxID=429131 RepID=A0A061J5D8_TRYRA|nr:hypothetical protein TRSC58_02732 [Trypanosoma rangeli SC58]
MVGTEACVLTAVLLCVYFLNYSDLCLGSVFLFFFPSPRKKDGPRGSKVGGQHKKGKQQPPPMASFGGDRPTTTTAPEPAHAATAKHSGGRSRSRRGVSAGRRAVKAEDLRAQLLQRTMRLVEKLLDVYIHDTLSVAFTELQHREREAAFMNSFPTSFSERRVKGEEAQKYTVGRPHASRSGSGTTVFELEQTIRERLQEECRVDAAIAAERQFASPHDDGFIFTVLQRLASMTEAEAKQEIHDAVAQYVDPHVRAFWEMKRLQREADGYCSDSSGLRSVQEAVHRAISAKKAELERHRAAQTELQRADRVHRVKTALSMLKKDVGNVFSLRYVVPEPYEALSDLRSDESLRRLRVRVHQQQLEEQELQQQLEATRTAVNERLQLLQDEVEAVRSAIDRTRQEISTKTMDIEELRAASGTNLADDRGACDEEADEEREGGTMGKNAASGRGQRTRRHGEESVVGRADAGGW